jgi:hypothetical protein
MNADDLKTYKLAMPLLEHLGGLPADGPTQAAYDALKDLTDSMALKVGHRKLQNELDGFMVLINGVSFRLLDDEIDLLRNNPGDFGTKIKLIKAASERLGLGLKDAKDLVEHYEVRLGIRNLGKP